MGGMQEVQAVQRHADLHKHAELRLPLNSKYPKMYAPQLSRESYFVKAKLWLQSTCHLRILHRRQVDCASEQLLSARFQKFDILTEGIVA